MASKFVPCTSKKTALWVLMSALSLAFVPACGDDDDDDDDATDTGDDSLVGAACDAEQNPFKDSCVNKLAACFDASGTCTNKIGLTGATLEWENGATVEVSYLTAPNPSDLLSGDFDFSSLVGNATTTGKGSNGTTCYTGETKLNTDDCAVYTKYVFSDGSGTLEYCSQIDGSTKVTCPDGTTEDLSVSSNAATQACVPGNSATCTTDTSGITSGLPSF